MSSESTLVIDIGGTGIKMITLDAAGEPVNERARELTPKPSTPEAVLAVIAAMVPQQPAHQRVSVGFPGVVIRGEVKTAPNLDTELWRDTPLQSRIQALVDKPTRVINDAELQGYGVITGRGVEMVLTLGTGLGTALYTDGHLVANLELGHHPFEKDKTYEQRVSNAEMKRIGKKKWSRRVGRVLDQLQPIFNYERIYLGGGNTRHLSIDLPANALTFSNVEGLRGGMRVWQYQ